MRLELQKLIVLQDTDTDIRRLQKSIKTAEQRRKNIEQEFEGIAFSIRELQNKRDSLHVLRLDLERHIDENRAYLKSADRNLKHAPNQKQYETAMRETDALQKVISMLETHVLDKMSAIDEVEKELDARADEINSLETDRAAALKAFDSNLDEEKKDLDEKLKKRQACFVTLPKRLAAVYDRLEHRSRDGIAVATVVNGTCSACFISLRPQLMLDVKMGKEIITCENCNKILHVVSENNKFFA